ncbi:MAG: hypothetical protein ACRET1_09335 [Burkholderiales bacterium]
MRIDSNLSLTFEVNDRATAFHSPLPTEIFVQHYKLLAVVQSALMAEGTFFQMGAGPRISAMMLRERDAKDSLANGLVLADGSGSTEHATSLFNEIKRLTTIAGQTDDGWAPLPVDAAIQRGVITADDWDEALNKLVFFSCHWSMAPNRQRKPVADAVASVLNGSMVSSNVTDFVAGLRTSTQPQAIAAVG